MASDATGSLSFEYFAFISYSRKDSHVAGWLQRKLEWYRFPTDLVDPANHPPHPTYVRPVVRDMTDLEVESNSFWEDIRSKLDRSRFLIVLCSPNAAKSAYVDREIRHFLHDSRRPSALQQVVPLIVAGQPGTADETECLPAVLQGLKDQILERNLPTMLPDAGQRDREGWENGLIQTVAYLLQVDRSKIADRYQRVKRRQIQRICVGGLRSALLLHAWHCWPGSVGTARPTWP